MLSMTSQSLAHNNGHLGDTLSDLTSDKAFKTMLISVGTAGITHGVTQAIAVPADAHSFVHHSVRETTRETVGTTLQAVVTGQGSDVGSSVFNVIGNIAQGMAAEGIGNAVDRGTLGMGSAMGAHGLVGTGAHLIRGGTLAESAAVGAATAMAEGMLYAGLDHQAIAEQIHKDHPKATPQEHQRYHNDALRPYREMAHITAATLAAVATNSESVGYAASHSAQMAMDHNFTNLVIGAGLTLNTLQPYYEAYQEAGGGAAGRATVARLVEANGGAASLGIEIAVNFAGGTLVMKAGSKLVSFIRGAGMTFVRGEQKINEVTQAERFSKTCRADDKRMTEKLGGTDRSGLKKPAKDMTAEEIVQNLADRAERAIPGTGRFVGTARHKHAEKLLKRYQKQTKEHADLIAEGRFKDGRVWREGMGNKGYVKPDVFNDTTKTAYDYKFGQARMSEPKVQHYQQQLPRAAAEQPAQVVIVRPTNPVK